LPFIKEILKHKSLSIVGMEKNTGKTECLNYILKRLDDEGKIPALTSIGIDGESIDQVTSTKKPEIELSENSIFVTSEMHYSQKKLDAEILDISKLKTSLGRLVTARAKSKGKVIFSGPPDTFWLKNVIGELSGYKPDIVIVDGALSRKSLGSPSVTDSMILTTGAALSANLKSLVKQTSYLYSLTQLPQYKSEKSEDLLMCKNGLKAIGKHGEIHDLDIPSVFLLDKNIDRLFDYGNKIFVSGVVNDKVLDVLRMQKKAEGTEIIVKDFTRIFAGAQSYNAFVERGGSIKVLLKTNLLAVCVNPLAPNGFLFDSDRLQKKISESIGGLPVYDIKKMKSE